MAFGLRRAKVLGCPCNFQDFQVPTCVPDPPTSQTDGRTHTRTTCNRKTALCSLVRRAVKQGQNTGMADIIGIADNVS